MMLGRLQLTTRYRKYLSSSVIGSGRRCFKKYQGGSPRVRQFSSSLKPNVLKNDPYIPIYAGLSTLAILGILTVYKSYKKTTDMEKEVEAVRAELVQALHADYKSCVERERVTELMAPTLVAFCWSAASTYSRHDFQGGVGGSTIRFRSDFQSPGLQRAADFLAPLHARHPGLSLADLWTLAAVVAIEALGGPVVPWVSGRSDVQSPDGVDERVLTTERCPVADSGTLDDDADHLKVLFGRIGGLNYKHIVALFGAHSVGSCHEECSGYNGQWVTDGSRFSNQYFKTLLEESWAPSRSAKGRRQFRNADGSLLMLPVDLALLHDPEFRSAVEEYAADEEAFFKDFSYAFEKLINNGVEESTVKRSYTSRVLGF